MAGNNKLHKLMTIALVRKLNMDGLMVTAASNFPDLDTPGIIGRHSPDVIARDPEGTVHFGEAKVYENLNTEKTKEQFLDFLTHIGENQRKAHLHIIIEKEHEEYLRNLLKSWLIISNRIHIWTY